MTPVAGVDGCRAGWIAAIWGDELRLQLCRSFAEVLSIEAKVIGIDMPIGFLECDVPGGRIADCKARQAISPHGSRIFPAPSRATVEGNPARQDLASEINRNHSHPPKAVGAQTFRIIDKMHQIDSLMSPDFQTRVFEVHPELSFSKMTGNGPIADSKKTALGIACRKDALLAAGFPIDRLPQSPYRRKDVAPDDILDACACAWSARRILQGQALRFPADPPIDERGLRMEINA
jgi:predicted RNase H-like nuclease